MSSSTSFVIEPDSSRNSKTVGDLCLDIIILDNIISHTGIMYQMKPSWWFHLLHKDGAPSSSSRFSRSSWTIIWSLLSVLCYFVKDYNYIYFRVSYASYSIYNIQIVIDDGHRCCYSRSVTSSWWIMSHSSWIFFREWIECGGGL